MDDMLLFRCSRCGLGVTLLENLCSMGRCAVGSAVLQSQLRLQLVANTHMPDRLQRADQQLGCWHPVVSGWSSEVGWPLSKMDDTTMLLGCEKSDARAKLNNLVSFTFFCDGNGDRAPQEIAGQIMMKVASSAGVRCNLSGPAEAGFRSLWPQSARRAADGFVRLILPAPSYHLPSTFHFKRSPKTKHNVLALHDMNVL